MNIKTEDSRDIEFRITEGDIRDVECDVAVLKYAQEFYQADYDVAKELGLLKSLRVPEGNHRYFRSNGKIEADNVLFVGVSNLRYFKYKQMRQFTSRSLEILSDVAPDTKHIVMTFHIGGLDETEAVFHCLLEYWMGSKGNFQDLYIK